MLQFMGFQGVGRDLGVSSCFQTHGCLRCRRVCHHSMVVSPVFQSDMYSLGVILLELFQPFGTEMERAHVLTGLRTGQIPEALSKQCPIQAKYIQHLTRKNSAQRPSAIQLLQSELFQNSGNVCTTYLILGKTGSPTWSLLFCFFSHGKNKFIERTERAPQGRGGPSQERHWPDVV